MFYDENFVLVFFRFVRRNFEKTGKNDDHTNFSWTQPDTHATHIDAQVDQQDSPATPFDG